MARFMVEGPFLGYFLIPYNMLLNITYESTDTFQCEQICNLWNALSNRTKAFGNGDLGHCGWCLTGLAGVCSRQGSWPLWVLMFFLCAIEGLGLGHRTLRKKG